MKLSLHNLLLGSVCFICAQSSWYDEHGQDQLAEVKKLSYKSRKTVVMLVCFFVESVVSTDICVGSEQSVKDSI
jgi:hypothetical protein